MREEINITIEGLDINKLLNQLYHENVSLRKIKYLSDTKISLTCMYDDYDKINKIAQNKYIVTVLNQWGPATIIAKLKNRKTTIAGVILFAAILIYQGMFISRIDITGLETIKEDDVRAILYDNGIFIGCRKGTYDMEATEFDIFDRIKGISWMELHQDGGVITVDIVEANKEVESQDQTPLNIVAQKEGYIEEIVPIHGQKVVDIGQYVYPGDVLISGELVSKIDETAVRYVHAEGQVFAKCIYVLEREEPVEADVMERTGRFFPGFIFQFGDFEFDSSKLMNFFDDYSINEDEIIELNIPLPIKFSLVGINETEKVKKTRNTLELKRNAEVELLKKLKKSVGKNGTIVNKDLQFIEEENIIKVRGIFEVIEEIGGEGPISYERTEDTN